MPPNTPDFDSMSPEEVMAWMESLAKRQGASEGFTTSADMDIEEVDPSTVIDEPGYVPFGEETRKPAAKVAPEPEPEPEPITELDMEVPADLDTGGMAWLESLAADQSGDFPQMDLAALSAELEPSDETEPIETTPSLDWLDSLAEAPETASPAVDDIAAIEDPIAAGIDPMVWLESLAKRQGARADELTTAADLDIPTPEGVEDTGPGYEDFTVESSAQPEREAADPAAWLESMTTGSTFHIDTSDVAADEEAMSDEDIQAALSSGVDIPPDQMEAFLGRQLDRQLSGGDVPIPTAEDYDPDAPPVPAELPDWLLEQVQPPDAAETLDEPDHQPALLDEIVAPPDIEAELPDWLQAEEDQEADSALESIFESAAAVAEPGIDASDPWVQAFTEEADTDPDAIPEWYARNVNDPERIAAVEKQLDDDELAAELETFDLPAETGVPAGEPEAAVPVWLQDEPEALVEAELPDWLVGAADDDIIEDIPDWLADTNVDVAPDEIPAWLLDTVETPGTLEEEDVIIPPEPEIPAASVEPTPAPEPVVPEPEPEPVMATAQRVTAPPLAADIAGTLEEARELAGSGDLDGCLLAYEKVIRANQALNDVVSDLAQLAEHHKNRPAVYRVLGDGLMRQGNLQAALDTYRKALNQL
jgi:tetratricopeptide (TPR) repeat protein